MDGHQRDAQTERRCSNAKMLRCSHAELKLACWKEVQRDIDFAAKRKVGHQSYLNITSIRTHKGPTLYQKSQTLQQLELQVST